MKEDGDLSSPWVVVGMGRLSQAEVMELKLVGPGQQEGTAMPSCAGLREKGHWNGRTRRRDRITKL